MKNTIRMLSLALLLGLLAALPSLLPARATGDFTITANPSALGRIIAGSTHKVIVNVTSTGGFSGTVSLSETDNGGITALFTPASVTVSSGGSAASTLKLTFGDCGVVGNSPLYVTGTSGSLSHQIFITYGPLVC